MKIRNFVALLTALTIIAATSLTAFAGTPFLGSPIKVGTGVTYIEAEDFDIGGENAHDTRDDYPTSGDGFFSYRSDGFVSMSMKGYADPADLQERDGKENHFLAYLANAEIEGHHLPNILEYTIDVEKAGTYEFASIASSPIDNHDVIVSFALDGADLGASVNIKDSGGWNKFRTQSAGEGYLPAGTHVLKVSISSGANVDAFVLTLVKEDTSGASSGSDSGSGGKDVPQTGDSNTLLFAVSALALGAAGLALTLKNRVKTQ